MSNKQNPSSTNNNHDEPRSGDLLREYRNNRQRSSPSSLPDQPEESGTNNSSSSGSSLASQAPVPQSRPAQQVPASQPLPKQDLALSRNPKSLSLDATISSAPLAAKEPVPDASSKNVDVPVPGIRDRSGPPSTPGISARRTRLARIEEPASSVSQDSQSFLASTVQMVRHLTGKMAAINQTAYDSPPPPMVLYRPSEPSEPQIRTRNWRRSHAVLASMRMRQR